MYGKAWIIDYVMKIVREHNYKWSQQHVPAD